LLTAHLGSVLVNNQLDAQFFFSYMFIAVLYMFRASSSVYTRRSPTYSDIYQMTY